MLRMGRYQAMAETMGWPFHFLRKWTGMKNIVTLAQSGHPTDWTSGRHGRGRDGLTMPGVGKAYAREERQSPH